MVRTHLVTSSFRALIALGALTFLASSASAVPIPFETGLYRLGNHPDGSEAPPPYGMRMDDLFSSSGIFTFDFECAGCGMFMDYDGASVRIFGNMFGRSDGGGAALENEFDGFYHIDVTYGGASVVETDALGFEDGLQDIGVLGETGGMIGTLEFTTPTGPTLPGLGVPTMWDLRDNQGSKPASLRVGDEDDDLGHRGFPGISGWGWLEFRETGSGDDFMDPAGANDFLFTARKVGIPLPSTMVLMGFGLAGVALGRRRR